VGGWGVGGGGGGGDVILRVIYVDDCTYCNTTCRCMYLYVHVYCMEYYELKWAMKQAN